MAGIYTRRAPSRKAPISLGTMSPMKRTIALLLLATAAAAQGVAAERGTLRVAVALDGRFEPADPARLALDTEQYKGPFELVSVVEHGTWVNEGDIVARFRRDAYEEQLKDREMGLQRAEMAHRHYLASQRLEKQKTERGLARAEREAQRAQKRLRGFREYEKAFRDERERQAKQAREYGMENQKDELQQLKKMYSEDELVDATEEIVLKRAERRYAQAVAREELAERDRVYRKEWYEHWTEEDYVSDVEAKQAALEAAREKAAMDEESDKLELARRVVELEKARRSLEEFRADGEKLTLRSPYRGLFMHEGGPWEAGQEFRPGTRVGNVMAPGAMEFVGAVKEEDILRVQPGLAVSVDPAAFPGKSVLGRLKLDFLPTGKAQFRATVSFDEVPTGLRPGMTGKGEIILEEARDAILVPASAVKDGKVFVLEGEQGAWRDVVVGPTDGKKTVIRDGLQAGEKVDPQPK